MKAQKILSWAVKVAGVVITAPATVIVAGDLFSDLPGAWRLLVQAAAVLLVEGVFLSNWLLLERNRRAESAYKVRYALTALGLYIGLWVLAWAHGEGMAGIVFRLALGAALIGTIWDAGVYDILRAARKTDKDVARAWSVRRLDRKLAKQDAKNQLRLDSEYGRAQAEARHAARMEAVKLERERLLQAARDAAPVERSKRNSSEGGTGRNGSSGTSWNGSSEISWNSSGGPQRSARNGSEAARNGSSGTVRNSSNGRKRSKRAERLEQAVTILRNNPTVTLRELGDELGVSHTTAGRYLKELEDEGRIAESKGEGYRVLASQTSVGESL